MANNKAKASNMKAFERANEAEQRRRDLSEALVRFVHASGAWVTSIPGKRLMTIEVVKNSSLPTKLTELGYRPILAGSTMRTVSSGFLPVDVIEIEITGR